MTTAEQGATRSVSISGKDLRDLRGEMDSASMTGDQKQLVGYLLDRAESESSDRLRDDFWTWTYRF